MTAQTRTTLFKRSSLKDHLREIGRRIGTSGSGFVDTKRFKLLLTLVLIAVLVFTAFAALAASGGCATPTITWVGNATTDPNSWHTPSNWDANRVPGAGDHVCIPDVANTNAISFSTGTTSVASLESADSLTVSGGTLELTSTMQGSEVDRFTLSGGTLAGAGNLTIPVGGTFVWTGGNMSGSGRTTISSASDPDPAATLSISGTLDKNLHGGRVLENAGVATFAASYLSSGTGAVIENSGSFELRGDGDLHYNFGGAKTRFENSGTLTKTAGTGTTTISASVDNDGLVEASTGTLDLSGGTDDASALEVSIGDLKVASGVALGFGGNHRLSGVGSSITGAGAVSFPFGTTSVGVETYDVTGATSVSGAITNFNTPANARTLNVSGGAANFNSQTTTTTLNLSGGTLGGSGTVTLPAGGTAVWSAGEMAGSGRTVISGASVAAGSATLAISGSSGKSLHGGRVLENAGVATFTSTTSISSGTGAVIGNSGVFDVRTDAHMLYNFGGVKTRFENTGTLKKTAGTATTIIGASVDNDGLVEVTSGTLDLSGGTDDTSSDTSTGDFVAASGTTLRLGGTHRLSGSGSSVTGAGNVDFSGGTTNVSVDGYSVSGTTSISGGATATFGTSLTTGTLSVTSGGANLNSSATAKTLNLSAGGLGGVGNLTIPAGGSAAWTGGEMTGSGRTVISGASETEPAVTLQVSGNGGKSLHGGRVLENRGNVAFTTTASMSSGTGAVIENSGVFDVRTDADVFYNFGGTKTRFENTGVLKKTGGTASTDMHASVDNDGSVEVTSGTLNLSGGTNDADNSDNSTGDFDVATGAVIQFSGTHRLSGAGSSVIGSGTVAFPSGASRVAVGSYDVAGTTAVSGGVVTFDAPAATRTLDFSGGTLQGGGTVTVPAGGTATWSGGEMIGTGKTVISGASDMNPTATLQISGNSGKSLHANRTLQNAGDATFTSTASISSGTGAVIENSGMFDFKTDADVFYNFGGTRTRFENTGTLKKSAGTSSTDIGAAVNNGGTMEVSSGTLNLTGGLGNFSSTGGIGRLSGGTYVVKSNSAFKFAGADLDVNAATVVLEGLGSAILDQNNADAIDNLTDNDGSLTIGADRDLTTVGALTNDGEVSVGADSVLTTTGDYVQATGSTALRETTSRLTASGAQVKVQGGTMEGVGTVGPVVNASGGTVAPGLSTGILRDAGSYTQGPGGKLEVEIGGTSLGTGHDQLGVGTTASLAGTLDIVTPSGFTPTEGESFQILECGAADCLGGRFDTVRGANIEPGMEYQVRYNATDVTLEYVDTIPPAVTAPAGQTSNEGEDKGFELGSFADSNDTGPWAVSVDWGDGSPDTTFEATSSGPLGQKPHAYDDDGAYNVTVTVSQPAGAPVLSGSATFAVNVANVAPAVTLSQTNDASVNESGQTAHTYEYAISDPGDDTIGSVDTSCGANGQKVEGSDANTDNSGSFRCVFRDGPNTSAVSASATDSDGAAGVPDTREIAITNVAPTVELIGAVAATEGETKTYTFTVTDPGDDPNPTIEERCGTNAVKAPETDPATPGGFDCTFTDGPASPTVSVSANDGDPSDNLGSDDTAVAVSNVKPTVTLDGPSVVDESATAERAYAFTVTDPGDDGFAVLAPEFPTCGANGTVVPDSLDTEAPGYGFRCVFTDGGPSSSPTVSDVAVRVKDDDATDTDTEPVKVVTRVDNAAPTATFNAPGSVNEGQDINTSLTDPNDPAGGNDTLSYRFKCGGSDWTAYGPGSTHSCPTADDGEVVVKGQVRDEDGGESEEYAKTVAVENLVPTVADAANAGADEGENKSFDLGSFADPGDDGPWSVSVDWGDGSEGATFTVDTPGPLGGRSHKYADDRAEPYAVTVTVAEVGADAPSGRATFGVAVANVAPDAVDDRPPVVAEGGTITLDVLANDADPGADGLAVTSDTDGEHGAASCDPAGSCAYTPNNADFSGTDSFTYTISDGDGGTDTAAVNVEFTGVNDAPSFTKGADQKVDEDPDPRPQTVSGWATGISAGPFEDGAVGFKVTANSNPALFAAAGAPAVSPDGTLTYEPAENASGTANVTLVARDAGGTGNGGVDTSEPQTFAIAVGAVNDAPTISGIADQQINEDTSTGPVPFEIGDVETAAGVLTVTATSANPELLPEGGIALGGEGKNRTITLTPAPGKFGTAEVTLTVDDGSGADNATAKTTLLLTVKEANNPPSDTVAPITRVTLSRQPNAAGWHNQNVTVTLDATDEEGGSGVKEIVYKTNSGEYQPYSAPFTVSKEGQTTISYRATDNAGNVEQPKSLTIKLDKTAPKVGSVIPRHLATGVAPATNVTAAFSEAMNKATINKTTVKLVKKGTTTPVAATVVYDTARKQAVLNPSRDLVRGATYTATVTRGAKDPAGNLLAASKIWSFTVRR